MMMMMMMMTDEPPINLFSIEKTEVTSKL